MGKKTDVVILDERRKAMQVALLETKTKAKLIDIFMSLGGDIDEIKNYVSGLPKDKILNAAKCMNL